ncbi:glycoside hydrolase [Pholiota molesta]|nr:glycoside hydrolase [Pholiota molesta]
MGTKSFSVLLALLSCLHVFAHDTFGVRDDLHFSLESRAENIDGSLPIYKNPKASIEDRVNDLLPRMTVEEKVSQIIQGDMNGWMDLNDPLDDTLTFNQTGLELMMAQKGGSIWAGYLTPYDKFVYGVTVGQKYLMENTTLGIPALIQSEGLHGFTNKGTIFPSPIGLAASFDTALISQVSGVIGSEAEGLGITHMFAPVLDLSRELRWGRVEENFGEDPFLTGEMGNAFVTGLQGGKRRNVSSTAIARVAATCKHFAAFGSPQGGLLGGERELRSNFLKPFNRACVNSLSIMTAYSSYDGIPAIANTHLLTDILRNEWGYKYWVTTDAGSVDLLINLHGTCDTRECAAKIALENGLSGEMGGGTYTYLTLPDQIKAGTVDVKYLDLTAAAMLRTKFAMGLFENPYPYSDYLSTIRTPASKVILAQADADSIVLLENRNNVLPLKENIGSIALLGPQVNRVTFGDYVFFNASWPAYHPLMASRSSSATDPVRPRLTSLKAANSGPTTTPAFLLLFKQRKTLTSLSSWSVGTWSLDQTLLWTPGTNATTGEHVDLSDLGLVGAQLKLVQAVKATGKPTIVVFVSGKPVAEPWIQENADAVIQQFYPGESGGSAIAEIIFGAVNPSGKLPVSFPRAVGTTPVFYNYLKGSRPIDAGQILDNGQLMFGHQYVLNSPVPLWSFGHGLSYTTFAYSGLTVSPSTISTTQDFTVTVTVSNTGSVDGKEVVQVYLTDVVSSVVTPNQELVGFQKVDIPAGKSATVSIKVLSSQLAVWSLQNSWVVEPGVFNIKVGTSDQTFQSTNLTVHA